MKLVLINSPIQEYTEKYRPSYRTTASLGLGYLGTIARNAGIETCIVDAESEKLSVAETIRKVNEHSPDVAGINMASTNFDISLKIINGVYAPFKMVGGAHATLMGERIKGDYLVVQGEAEEIFLDLLRNPRNGVVHGGLVKNLDALPFIDRSLFANDPYFIDGKTEATISTARGCPFQCVMCSVPTLSGRKVRARSVNNVLNEIEMLKSQDVDSVHFMDDIFNYSRRRVEGLCNEMIERGTNVAWRDLSRIEILDDGLLETMKQSGCYKLAFGIESGTPRVLDYIGKCSDLRKIRHTFRKCRELGIETKAFFTIGYPKETEAEIERTLRFAEELDATESYFMVVRAFPGTPLFEEMRARGFSEEALIKYKQFRDADGYVKYHVMNFNSLNGMPAEKLDYYVKEGYRRTHKKQEVAVA